MKEYIRPTLYIAALSLILGILPFIESQSDQPEGIPLYEIHDDGTKTLIRITPIDKFYVPEEIKIIEAPKNKHALAIKA